MAELVLHISVRTNNHSHLEALGSFFLLVTYPENIRVCTIAMQTEYSREVGSCTVHFDSVSCVCVMNNEL